MLLIASTRDWCTKSLGNNLKSMCKDVVVISATRSFGDISLGFLFLPIRFIFFPLRRPYYASLQTVIENTLFDLIVAIIIIFKRPTACLLWGGMSRFSLRTCAILGIKAGLYIGEEYLESASLRGIHQVWPYWFRRCRKELESASIILVESTFVKSSLPSGLQKKCNIVYSLIDDNYYSNQIENSRLESHVEKPVFKFGVISTYGKKNTKFVIELISQFAKYRQFELHIFGDKSYFTAGGLVPLDIPIILHPYSSEPKELAQLYSDIDLFLFPTLSDGGPRALMETCVLRIMTLCSPYSIGPDIQKYFPNLKVLELDQFTWLKAIEEIYLENRKCMTKLDFDLMPISCKIREQLKKIADLLLSDKMKKLH